ncbi:MAG: GNAT family N-acetyltransferase [Acidimicrobiales bacterium]
MEAARRAEPNDAPRLAALRHEAMAEIGTARGARLLHAQLARQGPVVDRLGSDLGAAGPHAGSVVMAGTLDGVVVGYGSARVDDLLDGERLGVIEELFVEPPARGVGVGEAIMTVLCRWCADQGCTGVDGAALPGDRRAKGFFERHGMTARVLVMHRELRPGPGDGSGRQPPA